jgi:integrase
MRSTIIFYPNTLKKQAKSGRIPIYLRVFHNNEKAESRLSEEITEDDLLKWNQMSMRLDDRNSNLNKILNSISNRFDDFKIINAGKLHQFDAKRVRDILMCNEEKDVLTIDDYANNYYKDFIASGGHITQGTKKNYAKAIKHLSNFVKLNKKSKIYFGDLSHQFAFEFWSYLISENIATRKKAMTEVSASGIIKKFRTIFDRAIIEDKIKFNPFKKLKLKSKSPFRQRLTISEIVAWKKCDLIDRPSLQVYKDVFLFCFYTGLAYSDVMELDYSHLIKVDETEIILKKLRHKTGERVEMFLPSFAITIIEKYKASLETLVTKKIFPKRSLKSLNFCLKLIAEKAGISTKVTTHIARHTFRQILAESGIQDDSVIKTMMGQSRNGTIDQTYYEVTESRLREAKERFEAFLRRNFLYTLVLYGRFESLPPLSNCKKP